VSKSDQSDRSDRSDRSDQSDQTPKSDQAPKAPQPAEQIPQHRPVSVTASPHGVAYSFGVLGILTLAVSGISFLKRRPRPI